jgi:hypothetical protein
MHDPERLRELAGKCRERAKSTEDPETIELLRRWAVELADEADKAEWNANDPGDPEIVRTLFEGEDERG